MKKLCKIEGCESQEKARGWCSMHYDRWRNKSDMTRPPKRSGGSLVDRFASFVGIAESVDCITWPEGARNENNYGVLSYRQKVQYAHRVSYEIHFGPIPGGLVVRHKCDNPPCVNPVHLELGTRADNNRDAIDRARNAFGERCGSSKLTDSQVGEILESVGSVRQSDLARKYSVSPSTISEIVNRKRWRHL